MGAKTRKLSQINDSLIEWQSVVVADGSTGLTAVAGRGYFINTTGGAITVTLPSATAKPGDTIQLKDYARTWGTNNVTIASTLLDGGTSSTTFSTNGQTVTLVRIDNTKGWSLINEDTTSNLFPSLFISATGGTVTTSGDFKIHSFTGDGCFVVATVGNISVNPTGGPSNVDYLVVAGGAAGGADQSNSPTPNRGSGGGGAGGFRTTFPSPGCNAGSFPISATTYPITVGAGGNTAPAGTFGGPGNPSIFSTITSAGGGGGGGHGGPAVPGTGAGQPGGSGGGAFSCATGFGTGNTPPVSPPQGNPGGPGFEAPTYTGAGGGGASAAGTAAGPGSAGPGGAGTANLITGSSVTYAGGGGGSGGTPNTSGTGGAGGGGPGGGAGTGTAGTANTGGGGGSGRVSAAGGKGIVIIRYKFQ